jgi:nucleotide-binding universal stress UspA family protein
MTDYQHPEPDGRRKRADLTAWHRVVEPATPSGGAAFLHGVVVGYDGSVSSERALAYAIGMAKRNRSGLIIVYVARYEPLAWSLLETCTFLDLPDHRAEVLSLELVCAEHLAGVPWIFVERSGPVVHALEDVGQEYRANAIVIGSPRGPVGRVLGSVVARLTRRALRPVVVVP